MKIGTKTPKYCANRLGYHLPCLFLMALILCLTALDSVADNKPRRKSVPFDDARLRIEVNATDGDSGLHILLDGEGWREVELIDPRGRSVLEVKGSSNVSRTGLTEMFFESAEPGFDELPLADFLKRFPAGNYRFKGTTVEGDRITGKATLTHALPDAPQLLSPTAGSIQDKNNTVIAWAPVPDPAGSAIVKYEVIVEDTASGRGLSVIVPANVHQLTVPTEFLQSNTEYKYEVLAIETGGNQTLAETAFRTAP